MRRKVGLAGRLRLENPGRFKTYVGRVQNALGFKAHKTGFADMRIRGVALGHLPHHLRVALAVGSIVTLLHGSGLLGWLDVIMLRVTSGPGPVAEIAAVEREILPAVLLISPQLYESEFAQASPLAPTKLARIVRTIVGTGGQRPEVLVIDLDLSPGPAEESSNQGRQELEAALREMVADGGTVVLPLPNRVATPEAAQKKFDWIKSLCSWNEDITKGRLVFGLAEVTSHQGVVAQLDANQPTIGMLGATPDEHLRICERVRGANAGWRAVLVAKDFDDRALMPARHVPSWRPYNVRMFGTNSRIAALQSLDRIPDKVGRLAGGVVFLGGGFNPQDQFIVPIEGIQRPVEGVLVHAALFDSVRHPVLLINGLGALALDIFTGVLLGYCFSASWGWHLGVVAMREHSNSSSLLGYWAPRISLAFNFALAATLAVCLLLAARLLFFPLNLWVNPGPMVIGVFAKFVLAYRGQHGDGNSHGPADVAAKRAYRLDQILLTLLVIAAVSSILNHH